MRPSKLRSARRLDPSARRTLDSITIHNSGTGDQPVGSSTSIMPPRQARSRSRSRSKQIASTAKKLVSPVSKTHRSSSRLSERKRSKSRRRKSPSIHTQRLEMTPSRLWGSLPMKIRVIVLIAGFVLVYHGLFAKHHHFDRESTLLRHDVVDLVRQANRTGFMQQIFIDAKLPQILEDDPESSSLIPRSPSKLKSDKDNVSSRDSPKKSEKSNAGQKEEKKNEKGEGKGKKRKGKKGKGKRKDEKGHDGENNDGKHAEMLTKTPNTTDSTPGDLNKSDGAKSTTKDIIKTSGEIEKNGTVKNESSIVNSQHGYDGNQVPQGSASDSSTNALNDSKDVTEAEETKKITEGRPRDSEADNLMSGAIKSTSSEREGGLTLDEGDYSKDFHDLRPEEVPKDHLPLLTWNYNAIIDPDVSEQVFGLGNKLDHVAVYKPLCIDVAKEYGLTFEGKTVCSGFNRTIGWFIQYCSVMRESARKEYLLQVEEERKTKNWLIDNKDQIRWVEGLTVLQVLEKNCGNIAHFAGRILLLQHIIDNIMAYSTSPRNPANILIVPTFHIMKRFLYPHNYEFWHKNFFQALIAPYNYTIGTLGNFLYRDSKPRPDGAPIVQLLHNFSIDGSEDVGKKYVCFRRAIVPSYLKARFFVNDFEYPSTKPSLQSTAADGPNVPRDSIRLRERVSALIDQNSVSSGRAKQIMLLDRGGSRRVFGSDAREKVLEMIKRVADEKGYKFTVTGFDKMTFSQQYGVMKDVAIAIGIHGANLVNAMFMPPLSVLFEIFPFGFRHEMYANGGNAGLKYLSHMMKQGTPFEGPKVYRTVEQCIRLNPKCKVHYRDATLQVTEEDMKELERLLRDGIDWCEALPNNESEKNERRRRRRRRSLMKLGSRK